MIAPVTRSSHTLGRPYPTDTNLGKVMDHLRISKRDVSARSGVNERTLTEYLAGRESIRVHHKRALAEALDVPEAWL